MTDNFWGSLPRELRSELRQSRWHVVVERLEQLGGNLASKEDSVFCRELRYLRKHGESGHLSYVKFSRRGLPLGNGAGESSIRREINLRMKSNGMFWTEENAEKMLQLRCRIMSIEWDAKNASCYGNTRLWQELQSQLLGNAPLIFFFRNWRTHITLCNKNWWSTISLLDKIMAEIQRKKE